MPYEQQKPETITFTAGDMPFESFGGRWGEGEGEESLGLLPFFRALVRSDKERAVTHLLSQSR